MAGGLLLLLVLFLAWELSPEKRTIKKGAAAGIADDATGYTVVGHIPKLHVLHASKDGALYGIEDHYLYVSTDGGKTFSRRGALPKIGGGLLGQLKNALARSRTLRCFRASRGPSNIEVLSSGTILVFYDRIYRSTDGGLSFQIVCNPASLGLTTGPFVFGVGTTVGADDTVYYGEYTCQKRPHPVSIVRGREDGTHWEIAHRFESGEIFHVHSIHYDPYRKGYWVCTGDTNEETALRFTADDFKTLTAVGKGSQDWRIVSLIIRPDYLYWGSDNDHENGSAIFRWSFKEEKLEKLQHIGKVSYYATQLANGTMAVSTTYEPNSPYTKANSPSASTELWISHDGENWTKTLDLPHEPMQMSWGPSRAQIAFPAGKPLEHLFLIPCSTSGDPFQTVVLDVQPPSKQRLRASSRAVA
jgi:hypothetical protein